ncbi:ATP-binding cassette domain-containing protein [Guyparkeria sp. SB14A]|uniref:ATP-binding cassette domain-containing protein n=1 Tax=Guyparkeria sp. SB14A TaxID=2571147 RepID=UPI0010AC0569|nr:ATP-binding cassette domain-containing protein [Guyparkeria sp. SB14A]TKA89460.1 ATP-binding cassette domain-containing protein [Guyparkeria sp. SB14A]
MPLLTVDNLQFAIGDRKLLDHANLTIERGEKLALIGRNGEGKSTFLKMLAGIQRADDGQIRLEPGSRVAYLPQDPHLDTDESVYSVIAEGLGDLHDVLTEYHRLAQNADSDAALDRLSTLQHELETRDGWMAGQKIDEVITRLGLDPDASVRGLSGGERRRVLLGQALVLEPDLLLLDEPTNHLDIAGIEWLEELVRRFTGAVVFITHDRAFLKRLANGIIELDRGHLTSWPGDYDNYLRRVEERANAEAQENARFDKTLAQEEVWIRQGIKARRTRNEGRVRNLEKLRAERAARREKAGKVELSASSGKTSGKIIAETDHVNVTFGEKTVIRDLSTTILRGDRVGLVGPNGAGKSTLIKLLLGQIEPTSGKIKRGSQLDIAYFDQHRAQLRDDWTALENLCDGGDRLEVGNSNVHGIGYLQQFLFTPERARTRVELLSGGERNRLLLAKLFAKPANLLVLDEPTNDLDLETLEVLEQALADYQGTLLLVSHDRAFLDNVVTSLLVFKGDGEIEEVIGGYQDYLDEQATAKPAPTGKPAPKPASANKTVAGKPRKPKKLSYKDQRELDALPARIEALESEQAELQTAINDPTFYQGDAAEIEATLARVTELEGELEAALERWMELEGD